MIKFFFSTVILITTSLIFSQTKKENTALSWRDSSSYTYLNINNISTVFRNNGISDIDEGESNSGLVFPKGSGKTAVFISGLIWGAFVPEDPQVRVGGSTYNSGLQGGKILSPGVAEDTHLPHVRIYRVRRDVYPGGPDIDLSVEVSEEGKNEYDIRTQYELDWIEWRADDGAPFDDIDGNGIYNPDIDIPGIPGADQTIWFVANDLDSLVSTSFYGAPPLGLEYQATYWAYNNGSFIDNVIFRKYRLINKSITAFNDMYVSLYSDTDIGNSTDDYAGCDTTLQLIYGYNGLQSDPTYNPLPPPAVGFDLLQGPIGDNNDRLPMIATYYVNLPNGNWEPPPLGSIAYSNIYYKYMQGKDGYTGKFFVNPITGDTTTFVLTGDPLTGKGWVDGILIGPGDRRIGLSCGPFQMAVGDTQEIIVAEIAAGAIPGTTNLTAIELLKFYDYSVQYYFDKGFIVSVVNNDIENTPNEFHLYQNYPNPFNPTTHIRYIVTEFSQVQLMVFDILGKEIATLVDDEKPAGEYDVLFNSDEFNLTSGIYFYQMRVGDIIETKKMMLLK